MTATIYENIFDKRPYHIGIDSVLNRIKSGNSRDKVTELRQCLDEEKKKSLKYNLPSVCFSGKFKERIDEKIIEHSGFIVLDFDHVEDLRNRQAEIISNDFVYACWVSPSGNGLKALCKVADGKQHRAHFDALREIFPDADKSGVNESRVCFESYDPDMYVSHECKPFTKLKTTEKIAFKEAVTGEFEIFNKIEAWLTKKGSAFEKGERNVYIFKLASACCRFGISDESTFNLIAREHLSKSTEFSAKEAMLTIKSAYKRNAFASASFQKDILVERNTMKEVVINSDFYDMDVKPKDVIYAIDVKKQILDIYDKGYASVEGLGIPELDYLFKDKRGEITMLSGIGNAGKSSVFKWRMVMRVLKFGHKFAIFGPEDAPAEEFFEDLAEMICGCDCKPNNPNRPTREVFSKIIDFLSKHVFYVYPSELSSTPEYIKERFLELIIKEKIDACIVDPFNQLDHDYKASNGRSDKYLETALADWSRFAKSNNVFFTIIAHPNVMKKKSDGNYECPDVFDLAGGAMWNNKMDNITIYHRPFGQTDPNNPLCEFHTKKIRRQKQVGRKGWIEMYYNRNTLRFEIGGVDHLQRIINNSNFDFLKKGTIFQTEIKPIAKEVKVETKVTEGFRPLTQQELDDIYNDGKDTPF